MIALHSSILRASSLNTYARYVYHGMQPVLQAMLLQSARARRGGSLHVASFLAMGGRHNNTRYRSRDELPCRAPRRFRRGSILPSNVLVAWRTLSGTCCANTLWTNPDVYLSVSCVYLSILLFIAQSAVRWLLDVSSMLCNRCLWSGNRYIQEQPHEIEEQSIHRHAYEC